MIPKTATRFPETPMRKKTTGLFYHSYFAAAAES